jgi:hypothetical protein
MLLIWDVCLYEVTYNGTVIRRVVGTAFLIVDQGVSVDGAPYQAKLACTFTHAHEQSAPVSSHDGAQYPPLYQISGL